MHASITDLEGVWLLEGYNKILDVSKNGFALYDETKISCVETLRGSLGDLAKRFDRFERQASDRASMYRVGGITRYLLSRQSDLPSTCHPADSGLLNDPVKNFEVFWHTFAENYVFFELRKVDWKQVYTAFRPRVTSETSQAELFQIFVEILNQLGDMHVSLDAGDRKVSSAKPHPLHAQFLLEYGETDHGTLMKLGLPKLNLTITNDFLGGVSRSGANDLICGAGLHPGLVILTLQL